MDAVSVYGQEILKSGCWLLSSRGSRSFGRSSATLLCRYTNREQKETDEEEAESTGDIHNLNHLLIAYFASTAPTRIVRHALDKSKTNLREKGHILRRRIAPGARLGSEMLLSAIDEKECCKFYQRQLD